MKSQSIKGKNIWHLNLTPIWKDIINKVREQDRMWHIELTNHLEKGKQLNRKMGKGYKLVTYKRGNLFLLFLFSQSVVLDTVTPWAVACQAPLFVGFPRQEYWSKLLFPSLGDLSNPGIKPRSPALQADFSPFKPPGNKCQYTILIFLPDFSLSFGNLC